MIKLATEGIWFRDQPATDLVFSFVLATLAPLSLRELDSEPLVRKNVLTLPSWPWEAKVKAD